MNNDDKKQSAATADASPDSMQTAPAGENTRQENAAATDTEKKETEKAEERA